MSFSEPTKQAIKKPPFYIAKFKWLLFLLIILSLAACYFLLITPQHHAYIKNQEQLKQLDRELEANLDSLSKNKEIIDNYQAINTIDKEKINQILPAQPNLSDLYVNLETLVKQNGLILEDLVISEPKPSGSKKSIKIRKSPELLQATLPSTALKTLEINLTLSGVNYVKMKELFSALEANLRLFDVDSFNFDPENGKLDFILKAYYIESSGLNN